MSNLLRQMSSSDISEAVMAHKPWWVSTVTVKVGKDQSFVVASYGENGRCSCKAKPQVRVGFTPTSRSAYKAALIVFEKVNAPLFFLTPAVCPNGQPSKRPTVKTVAPPHHAPPL